MKLKHIVLFSALLPVFISVVFFICIFCIGEDDSVSGGSGNRGNGGSQIVAVALSQLGDENNGGSKYKGFMGLDASQPWCAAFVSWCANECGFIESGIIPASAWCNDFRTFAKEDNRWTAGQAHGGGSYLPKAGDLILFDWTGSTVSDLDHIGIVKECDGTTVFTVEGNSGNAVNERTYPIGATSIIGYFSPDYPQTGGVGDLQGATNAEKVYNAFVTAGYTKEAAAAVVGNLAGEGGTDANGDIVIDSTEAGSGEGIGICQWSLGRKTAFMEFARSKGEPWPDTGLGLQLEYMMIELETDQWLWTDIGAGYGSQYHISFEDFKKSKNVEFATGAFCANFERCYYVNSHLSERVAYAKRVLNSFG